MAHFEQARSLTGSARLATVVVLGMAAVVHNYGEAFISKDICRLCYTTHRAILGTHTVERIDAIWDNYPEGNLKSLTHQRRGTGLRTRIGDGHTQIPKHEWNSGFLKNEENKKELFSFLSEEIVKKDLGGKLLLSTKCERVLSNRPYDVSALEPCNHSEADTMIVRHLLELLGWLREWEKLRDIPIHDICSDLGPSRYMALPLFHTITGCDTISHFLGCGKKRVEHLGKIHHDSLKHCWH